jgi:hypothetical protein
MLLRILIYSQIVWIAIVGLMARELIHFPGGGIAYLIAGAAQLIFPILVFIAVWRSNHSADRKFALVLIEVGLLIAYMIAFIPAVQ